MPRLLFFYFITAPIKKLSQAPLSPATVQLNERAACGAIHLRGIKTQVKVRSHSWQKRTGLKCEFLEDITKKKTHREEEANEKRENPKCISAHQTDFWRETPRSVVDTGIERNGVHVINCCRLAVRPLPCVCTELAIVCVCVGGNMRVMLSEMLILRLWLPRPMGDMH